MTKSKEHEILRMFYSDVALSNIAKRVKESEDYVLSILMKNPSTATEVRDLAIKHDSGKFVSFFYSSKMGRSPLPENKKRKARQIRMSDDELAYLGNPNSTQMRSHMMTLRKIELMCEQLDAAGIELIPSEWLDDEYPFSDPFWNQGIHSKTFYKLKALAESNRSLQRLIDGE